MRIVLINFFSMKKIVLLLFGIAISLFLSIGQVFAVDIRNNIENIIFSFDKNFVHIITQADLCITRAGASTLAELSILNIASCYLEESISKLQLEALARW